MTLTIGPKYQNHPQKPLEVKVETDSVYFRGNKPQVSLYIYIAPSYPFGVMRRPEC